MTKSTTSLFQQWFRGKRYFNLLLCRKACPLTFHERLAWSYVAYRSALGGVSRRELSRATGLDRCRTVPKIIGTLVARSLVLEHGDRLTAVDPPQAVLSEWFVQRAKPCASWFRRLYGFPVCWTSALLTPMRNAIYFCLLADNVQQGRKILPHQRKAGIAAMLHVSRDTVRDTLKQLEKMKLIDYVRMDNASFSSEGVSSDTASPP